MRIRIKGLDEVKRKLEEMQEGLTLPALQRWAKKIEDDAKSLASTLPLPSEQVKNSIHVEAVETEPKRFQIKADAMKEGLSLIVEATRSNLSEMPVTSKLIFDAFLKRIEEEELKIKSSISKEEGS